MARKPCAASSTTANVVEHHAGALNIDACRVAYQSEDDKTPVVGKGEFSREKGIGAEFPHHKEGWGQWQVNHSGRYPANVVLCGDEVAATLDDQSGVSVSSGGRIGNKDGGHIYGGGKGLKGEFHKGDPGYGDTGGASRYFKQVKK